MKPEVKLLQGNQACALGAIAAGVEFFAGYPITPSTEIAEILASELPKLGGKFIQMEDEIASMGAICGASLTGVKSITATSGPGFSLKQELIGYAAMAEIPVVVVNVQRLGPSTGKPTSPAQGDVMQARWGTHGDRAVIALSPWSVKECFDVTVAAVNFSEKLRTPVILLLDEIVGHMREGVVLPRASDIKIINRKLPTVGSDGYEAYRPEDDEVPAIPPFGTGYLYHVTGLSHGFNGMPTESSQVAGKLIKRLHTKIERAQREITLYDEYFTDDAEMLVIAYGGTARSAIAAVKQAREQGVKAGLLRLVTLWPFPAKLVERLGSRAYKVLVPELNYGQLICEVERYLDKDKCVGINRVDGEVFKPNDILDTILHWAGR